MRCMPRLARFVSADRPHDHRPTLDAAPALGRCMTQPVRTSHVTRQVASQDSEQCDARTSPQREYYGRCNAAAQERFSCRVGRIRSVMPAIVSWRTDSPPREKGPSLSEWPLHRARHTSLAAPGSPAPADAVELVSIASDALSSGARCSPADRGSRPRCDAPRRAGRDGSIALRVPSPARRAPPAA